MQGCPPTCPSSSATPPSACCWCVGVVKGVDDVCGEGRVSTSLIDSYSTKRLLLVSGRWGGLEDACGEGFALVKV